MNTTLTLSEVTLMPVFDHPCIGFNIADGHVDLRIEPQFLKLGDCVVALGGIQFGTLMSVTVRRPIESVYWQIANRG